VKIISDIMISVICVYNDPDSLNKYLLPRLEQQTVPHEQILLDNSNGKFKSSAEALNYGANKAKGDYLLFVHQDVDLESNSWLGDAEKILDKLMHDEENQLGIAGVAGMSIHGKNHQEQKRNVIKHEIPPVEWGNPLKLLKKLKPLMSACSLSLKIPSRKYNLMKKPVLAGTSMGWTTV
jgi:hypothetical protein